MVIASSRTEPLQPKLLGIRELLKSSLGLFQRRWKIIVAIHILLTGLLVLVFVLGWGVQMALLKHTVTILRAAPPLPSRPYSPLVLIILLVCWMFLITFLAIFRSAALTTAIWGGEQGFGVKDSLRKGWSKTIPLICSGLLVGSIVSLGVLLLFVPGIILMVWYSFVSFIVVIEGITGRQALSRSKQLVSRFWWSVVRRQSTLWILFFLAEFILGIIPFLGILIGVTVVWPLKMVYSYLLYQNIKAIKEINPDAKESPLEVKKSIFTLAAIFILLIGWLSLGFTRLKEEQRETWPYTKTPLYQQLTPYPYGQSKFGELVH